MKKISPAVLRVLKTVEKLYDDNGDFPSYDVIREAMGGASYNTISKGIKIWKSKQLEGQQQERPKELALSNQLLNTKNELQHKVKFEKIISELLADLVNIKSHQFDAIINKTLKNLTRFTLSDRCYLFQFNQDETFLTNTYEWCNLGIKPQIDTLKECRFSQFKWFFKQLKQGKDVLLEKKDIPEDSFALKKVFTEGDIQSIINIPFFYSNRFQGFIGLDNPRQNGKFLEQDILLLQTVINILSKAFEQWHIEKLHEYSKEQAQRYLQIAGVMILALNEHGDVTMINDKGCEILGYTERDILGKNWLDHFLPKEIKNDAQHILSELMAGNIEPYKMVGDGKVRCSDGSERWISWHNSVLKDSLGRIVGILTSGEDITERKLAEQKLIIAEQQAEREKTFLQSIMNGVADPIMVIGLDYKVQMMNHAAKLHLPDGYENSSCFYCYQVSHQSDVPCHLNEEECPLEIVKQSLQSVSVIHEHGSDDNAKRIYELIASPLFDDQNELTGIIESSRDITERLGFEKQLNKSNQNVHHLTYHDQLTSLPNQLLLADRLDQLIKVASEKLTRIAVFHLDLDRFKKLNETFGRSATDKILLAVSDRLKKILGKSDTLARLGADEFVIISSNISDIDNVAVLAQQILETFNEPYSINKQINQLITACIGVSLYPQDGDASDVLLHKADTALHKAKDEGRNSFQFYQEDMTAQTFAYVMMESNLRKSLIKNELVLFYQPKIDLNSGNLSGLEALIRWQHDEMGLVSPARFIPIAEESGLIIEIGEWVIRTACIQALKWHQQGLFFGRIAVNLSSKQFLDKNLFRKIKIILDETGCPANLLELEVTESHLMEDVYYAVHMLEDIRCLGIKLSIDDFGTGYSSMSQLKQLPIDRLKIDRSFVQELPDNKHDKAISQAIIALGSAMGLTIIAEGVETREQAEFLKSSGCHQGQGFLFYKPLSVNEVINVLSPPQK